MPHPLGQQCHPVFEPQCSHLSMTRIYDSDLVCAVCRRPGPHGWIYSCSQDREDLIEHIVFHGDMASFDLLGHRLSELLQVRRGSPAAREDRLSFFDEISHSQMAGYRPDQVATILRQRENVQVVIQLQRLRSDSAEIISPHTFSDVFEAAPGPFDYKKPWVLSIQEECKYRVCPRCRPALADRAFLGLDSVAVGDVPPTAAVGYGFHIMGERPVVNADILKNLGHRSDLASRNLKADSCNAFDLPMPSQHLTPASKTLPGRGSFTSRESIRRLFDESADLEKSTGLGIHGLQAQPGTLGSLKHSPRCRNLGKYALDAENAAHDSVSRVLWTPPPSPNPNGNGSLPRSHRRAAFFDEDDDDEESKLATPGSSTLAVSSPSRQPGRGQQFGATEDRDGNAILLPLRHDSERDMRKFAPSPLRVRRGVAVLEESVELGVPDVITHE